MKTFITVLLLVSTFAMAAPAKFGLDLKKSSIHYFLPYSTGTSEGDVRTIDGAVSFDPDHPEAVSGEFSVPISGIDSGSEKRTCHLWEALGLNYATSDFPKDHVCDGNKLPATGKNAISYPTILFKILTAKKTGENQLEVDGSWTIHGITHTDHIKLTYAHDGKDLRVKGELKFSLKDYGIVVKPAQIVFVTISVHDDVRVPIDLSFVAR